MITKMFDAPVQHRFQTWPIRNNRIFLDLNFLLAFLSFSVLMSKLLSALRFFFVLFALTLVCFLFTLPCSQAFSVNDHPYYSTTVPVWIAEPDTGEEVEGDEHDHDHDHTDAYSADDGADPTESLSFYDSLQSTFEYKFTYHKRLYHKHNYTTSSFSNRRIDLYRVNVSEIEDTFNIVLHDPFNGENFCAPIKGRVTSRFGPRRMYSSSFHYGTDVALRIGDTIRAVKDGFVRIARYDKYGYGNFIVVTHKGGLESLYGHLSKHLVEEGQIVKAGEVIGLGGNTGRSSGPHLHFEFRILGDAFDPAKVISFTDGKLKMNELNITRMWFAYRSPALMAKVDKQKPSGPSSFHTVRPGDTLGHIARTYNTTTHNLCTLNRLTQKSVLQLGHKIRVM